MTDKKLQRFRREYLAGELSEDEMLGDPHLQFLEWIDDAVKSGVPDPTAMVLATADPHGKPSIRIVLLKEARASGLIFFSNYESRKGKELTANHAASVLFFWPGLERQLRIEGRVEKLPEAESDAFFNTRSLESRISAIVSHQSQTIAGREQLQKAFEETQKQAGENNISRPAYWGGYMLKPESYEFWQGREHRLNDRLEYYQSNGVWVIRRLAP